MFVKFSSRRLSGQKREVMLNASKTIGWKEAKTTNDTFTRKTPNHQVSLPKTPCLGPVSLSSVIPGIQFIANDKWVFSFSPKKMARAHACERCRNEPHGNISGALSPSKLGSAEVQRCRKYPIRMEDVGSFWSQHQKSSHRVTISNSPCWGRHWVESSRTSELKMPGSITCTPPHLGWQIQMESGRQLFLSWLQGATHLAQGTSEVHQALSFASFKCSFRKSAIIRNWGAGLNLDAVWNFKHVFHNVSYPVSTRENWEQATFF